MTDNGYLLPDFYSGPTGRPGRFSEGFALRRLYRDSASEICIGKSQFHQGHADDADILN
jgi:hypothetical protein